MLGVGLDRPGHTRANSIGRGRLTDRIRIRKASSLPALRNARAAFFRSYFVTSHGKGSHADEASSPPNDGRQKGGRDEEERLLAKVSIRHEDGMP
jgi:hypothetical protein